MKKSLCLMSAVLCLTSLAGLPGEPENAVQRPVVVYRGQLINGAGGAPLTFLEKTTVPMTFRAYGSDRSDAEPLWCSDQPGIGGEIVQVEVPVNPDGSFSCTLGDTNLVACIVTGLVTHVGVTINKSSVEVSPRRMLVPIASVTRALIAEQVANNAIVGTMLTKDLVASRLAVQSVSAKVSVTGRSAAGVTVRPTVAEDNETTIVKGSEVSVLAAPQSVESVDSPYRGQELWTATGDGMVLIHSDSEDRRSFRIPGVVQFVRAGDIVRAPTSETGSVSVEFYGYAQK